MHSRMDNMKTVYPPQTKFAGGGGGGYNDSYENLFPYMAFVYAWIVFSWADPLRPQHLMEQFDTLLIQCTHIEHMHEGVLFGKNNFCLHRFYCNLLFKTKVCWFEL